MKKTAAIILSIILTLCAFTSVNAYEEFSVPANEVEKKSDFVLPNPDIKYSDNEVIFELTRYATSKFKSGEWQYTTETFSNLGVTKVEFSPYQMSDSKRERYWGLLTLDKHDIYNIVDVVGKLMERDDIYAAWENGYDYIPESLTPSKVNTKAGKVTKIVDGYNHVSWKSSDKKVAKVSKNGTVTALAKGKAKITATLPSGKTVKYTFNVKTNPALTRKGKAITKLTLKKGKSLKLRINGKAKSVNNKYSNAKIAKISAKNNAEVITVKALKKGSAKLYVTVNGKKLSLKVTVI